MRRIGMAGTLTAAIVLSSCGADGPGEPSRSATEIGQAIQADIPEITEVVTITEDNDANNLIGRPGGYIDGAVLFDSRTNPMDDTPGAAQGAFLEVWPDEDAASGRAEYIQGLLDASNGLFGTEYHYQRGGLLLRVTGELKPTEAEVYEAAFDDNL